jgi:hypothetical protein
MELTGGTPAEEFIGQMMDEFPDRRGGVETWDGGAPGVTNDTCYKAIKRKRMTVLRSAL